MKGLLNTIMSFLNIVSMIMKFIPIQNCGYYKYYYTNVVRKMILYGVSSVFLISFYIFGCMALYSYLMPYWGEVLAAFSLCLLSLSVSIVLILIAHFLKAKKKQAPPQIIPDVEKSLDQMLNSQELTKVLAKASPKILVTMLGVVALASFVALLKKK